MFGFLSYALFHFRYSTKLSTFPLRFIKIINVDKITNAFVIFCKRCKRLLHLWTEVCDSRGKEENNVSYQELGVAGRFFICQI